MCQDEASARPGSQSDHDESPTPHLPLSHSEPVAQERNNLWSTTETGACLLLQQSLAYPD